MLLLLQVPVPQLEKIPEALAADRGKAPTPHFCGNGEICWLRGSCLRQLQRLQFLAGRSSSHLPGPLGAEPGSTEPSSLVFQGNSNVGICSSLLRSLGFGVAMLIVARAASATYQTLKSHQLVLAQWEQPGSVLPSSWL